jgi:protein SCO1/2
VRRLLVLLVLLALAGAAAAAIALALAGGSGASYRGSRPPARVTLPDFRLRSANGPAVRSGSLRGKAVAVTFLESRCTAACPVVAFQLARGLRLLAPKERAQVVALAISVHPGDDTPRSVRAFLRRQHAEREVAYLIGSERELRPVWRAFQVVPALDTGDPNLHSVPVRIFDRRGVWVSTLHAGVDLTPDNLRHDLLAALS